MSQYMYVTDLVNTVASRERRKTNRHGDGLQWNGKREEVRAQPWNHQASEAVSVQSYVWYCTTPQTFREKSVKWAIFRKCLKRVFKGAAEGEG
jgi:hypothetical protein